MGSNCCKNALDKVRPPARPSGFDAGEPPDPAAPWPGDTFCRAPAAQAPPAFPEGGFDSPSRFHGSFAAANTALQPQETAAEDVPPSSSSLRRRRSSVPAGSGSTAVSLSPSEQPQQRISRASSAEARGIVAGSISPTAGPSSHKGGGGSNSCSWRAGGAAAQGSGGRDAVRSAAAAADGSGRFPARLRQALSVSRRRLTSRLRLGGPGSRKQETGDGAGEDRVGGGGETAVVCRTAALSSADAAFPKDAVDETHFVRYPPPLSPSSECLDPLWPAAAATWAAPAPPPAVAASGTAAAAARGDGDGGAREGGDSSGGWTSGSGLASTAVSWNTPVSSSPSAAGGGGVAAGPEEGEARRRVLDAAAAEAAGGGETAKQLFPGERVASPLPTKKRSSCGSGSAKDQRWLLKRSKGSSAASTFRAAVEGALPRWKGSRASKGGSGTARSRSSSGAEGGDWQERQKGQELSTTGEPKRARCRDKSSHTQRRSDRRSALRSCSHRSSASTAAQEEDDYYTTAGMEYWWTTSLPSQQEADEEQLTTTDVHCRDFQGALPAALPVFGEADFTQQRAAAPPVRQRQQQLAAGCGVPACAGLALGAAQTQAEVAAVGRAPEASAGLCLGGAGGHHQAARTTDRLLASSSLVHDANTRINTRGSILAVNAAPAATGETHPQQPQQPLTNGLRVDTSAASFAAQDLHGYAGLHEHSSNVGSTGGYVTCTHNISGRGTGRVVGSGGDVINGTAAAVNGGSSRGDQDTTRGNAWVQVETNAASGLNPVVHETAPQQQHAASYRQQNEDESGSGVPVVAVPFPE